MGNARLAVIAHQRPSPLNWTTHSIQSSPAIATYSPSIGWMRLLAVNQRLFSRFSSIRSHDSFSSFLFPLSSFYFFLFLLFFFFFFSFFIQIQADQFIQIPGNQSRLVFFFLCLSICHSIEAFHPALNRKPPCKMVTRKSIVTSSYRPEIIVPKKPLHCVAATEE